MQAVMSWIIPGGRRIEQLHRMGEFGQGAEFRIVGADEKEIGKFVLTSNGDSYYSPGPNDGEIRSVAASFSAEVRRGEKQPV